MFTARSGVWIQCLVYCAVVLPGNRILVSKRKGKLKGDHELQEKHDQYKGNWRNVREEGRDVIHLACIYVQLHRCLFARNCETEWERRHR